MNDLFTLKETYLDHCLNRKRLDEKTVRAYRCDLNDFSNYLTTICRSAPAVTGSNSPAKVYDDCIIHTDSFTAVTANYLDKKYIGSYIDTLHQTKSPRTVRRRIASLQAFYHYLVYEEIIPENPLYRLDLTFKLPKQLPRYIPNHVLSAFYRTLYQCKEQAATTYQYACSVRNIAVVELLFATGLRISELCSLTTASVRLPDRELIIHGKGNRERILQLTEDITVHALEEYRSLFEKQIESCGYFFVNGYGSRLSDQSVRNMLHKISRLTSVHCHITPHMFRHTFATSLVNQDVDIRCIQELLGHTSIKTTEIYTHVDLTRQKTILAAKNPRKTLCDAYSDVSFF